jgi:crossover junction endodeoxyribonuclease RuvC
MRILGIDPGLRTTGFGVIDAEGSALRYVASGTVSTTHLDTRPCRRGSRCCLTA